jgi:hypothetical protein
LERAAAVVIAGEKNASRGKRVPFRSMNMSNSEATAVISPSPRERGEVSAEIRSRVAFPHPSFADNDNDDESFPLRA